MRYFQHHLDILKTSTFSSSQVKTVSSYSHYRNISKDMNIFRATLSKHFQALRDEGMVAWKQEKILTMIYTK